MSRIHLFLPACFCAVLFTCQPLLAQQVKQPNIILFLVDDMGWEDSGVPFWDQLTAANRQYHTPNMERLASEGMKLTNAYATPVCTPSRVSLMTGMNAAHHRVTNWTSPLKNTSTDDKDSVLDGVNWNINGLSITDTLPRSTRATPLPEILKQAGYFTIHVGKAHFAPQGTPCANPVNMGFLVNIAGHAAGHPQSYLSEENYGNMPGQATAQAVPDLEAYYGSGTFLTEALTQRAIQALEHPVQQHQPFCLYLAHYAVHVPLMADKRFYQSYIDKGMAVAEACYASMIEGMDKSLGDIMHYLENRKIDKNTIILFMSDNGGLALAPPRGGAPFTQNYPLQAGKGSVYEGGIREPMLVKWPGVTTGGSVTKQYVAIEDFFPSLLEMAGIRQYHTIQDVDGKSFVPLLHNPALADTGRCLVWHYPNKWIPHDGPGINYASAIRQGSWKLVYLMKQGKLQLFNLDKDIGEQQDVSAAHPAKVKALAQLLTTKLKYWQAQLPRYKQTGRQVPWPDELLHDR